MARLSVSLLGAFEVTLNGAPVTAFESDKVRALLAYLAVEAKQSHRRESLAGLLWPELPERRARRNLSQALFNLRQTIDDLTVSPPVLLITSQTLQFNRSSDHCLDVADFTTLLATVEEHRHRRLAACEVCLGRFEQAVALYRGMFLEGLSVGDSPAFEEWALLEREQIQRLLVETLHRLTDSYEQRGEYAVALPHARRWLELAPWQEEAHQQLMRLLALNGQCSAALTQYESCCRYLAEELDVEPGPETIALYERIRDGDLGRAVAKQPGRRGTAIRHNLPPPPTPFVGRKQELAKITRRLADPACRLLTLTGPGGIGKTRLALQAASNLIEAPTGQLIFSGGIYFVNVTPISSIDSLVATIAEAFNFSFYRDVPPRQQLLDYLREKEMLLGLDNFEHLLSPPQVGMKGGAFPDKEMKKGASPEGEKDGATELVADILTTAPAVKIIVTSRETLNLQGEWLFPVDGLPFPTDDAPEKPDTTKTVAAYSAVQLFEQCARRARPGFSLAGETEDVVRICQMVEGMPLGIELAAAWLKMFPCDKIRRELERGLDLLTTSLKDVPARHRSMRAVFEHSWHLLSEAGREVFKRLSVFRGGFRQEAAEQVTGATFSDMVALGEKSLLRLTPAGRYQVHELLRQYSAEKLAADPSQEMISRDRHSAFYATFMQQREVDLKGAQQQPALAAIEADLENVLAAWHWAVECGRVASLEQALDSLGLFYEWRGRYAEGAALCRVAGEKLTAGSIKGQGTRSDILETGSNIRALARILTWQARFHIILGHPAEAEHLLRQSQSLLDLPEVTDQDIWQERAFLLMNRGELIHHTDAEQGRQLLEQSRILYQSLGDRWAVAKVLNLLADLADWVGHRDQERQLLQESLRLRQTVGDLRGMAESLGSLGLMAALHGQRAQSESLLQQSLAVCQEIGEQMVIAEGFYMLGFGLYFSGKFAEARTTFEETVALKRELGDRQHLADPMLMLGVTELDLGRYDQARRQLQQGLSLSQELGDRVGASFALWILGEVSLAEEAYVQAQQLLQESVALHREMGIQTRVLEVLVDLGYTACSLGHLDQAQVHLLEVLGAAPDVLYYSSLAPAFVLAARLLVEQGRPERAVELYALAKCDPRVAHSCWFEAVAGRHITAAAATLPPEVVTAAQERGQAQDPWDTARELLVELEG